MLAALSGAKNYAMAIASGTLRTVLVTRHNPLRRVPDLVSEKKIAEAVEMALKWMEQLHIKKPRIGVCALNPHAGENGLLGTEEKRIITPAIVQFKRRHKIKYSADSGGCRIQTAQGKKIRLPHCAISRSIFNSPQTLLQPNARQHYIGVAFVRTSPGHGTASDIYGKNKADETPMVRAIQTASRMAARTEKGKST